MVVFLDVWMVLDMTPPPLSEIYVYGVLEVEPGLIGSLSATHIVVMGKLIVGAEGDPFTGDFSFILRGSHSTPQVMLPAGPAIGAKAIGNEVKRRLIITLSARGPSFDVRI